MIRLRSLGYALRGWCHYIKGQHFRHVESMVSYLAMDDAKKTGKIIEIMNGGRIETYFPCGCRVFFWPESSNMEGKQLSKMPCGSHYNLEVFGKLR